MYPLMLTTARYVWISFYLCMQIYLRDRSDVAANHGTVLDDQQQQHK